MMADDLVDFKDSGDLRKWLEGKSWEVPAAMVARAALRVLPILSELFENGRMQEKDLSYIVLPVFRAMSLTTGAAKYQMFSGKLLAFAVNAAVDLAAANEALAADSGYITDAVAYASHGSASFITYAIDDADVNTHDLVISVHAGLDATFIDHGAGPEELHYTPLWQNEMPDDFAIKWNNLKKSLLTLNEGWQVWINWYEDILVGRNRAGLPDDLAKELDLKIALQEDDWWKRDVAEVNGDIAAWTVAALGVVAERKNINETSKIPPIKSGTVQPVWNGNILVQSHMTTGSNSQDEMISAYVLALKNELPSLEKEVANTANFDQRVLRYFRETAEILPEGKPLLALLYQLIMRESFLLDQLSEINAQWPTHLAARLRA